MNNFIRKTLPMLVASIAGFLMVTEWFFVVPGISSGMDTLKSFAVIVAGFMFAPALINLYINHGRKIMRSVQTKRDYQWFFSAVLIIVSLIFIGTGILVGPASSQYQWVFNSMLLPAAATGYAGCLFPMLSGCFRYLRARNKMATVLLITCILVLLRNMPIVTATIPGIIDIVGWIDKVIVTSAYRAITIGIGVGSLIFSLKVLLGQETRHLGWRGEE